MAAIRPLKLVLAPAVRQELAERFDRSTIRAILKDAFEEYDAQRPSLPREESLGGRLMVRLSALTIGLYRALLRHDLTREEARSLTARATARVYGQMATVPTALSAAGAKSAHERVKRATDQFRRFPFSAPSYDMVDVDAGDGTVAFDVRRCPAAEYFRSQGLSDLCVASWCNLDFSLAERWGARLERNTTIAGGARVCDFRWHVDDGDDNAEEVD